MGQRSIRALEGAFGRNQGDKCQPLCVEALPSTQDRPHREWQLHSTSTSAGIANYTHLESFFPGTSSPRGTLCCVFWWSIARREIIKASGLCRCWFRACRPLLAISSTVWYEALVAMTTFVVRSRTLIVVLPTLLIHRPLSRTAAFHRQTRSLQHVMMFSRYQEKK